MLRLFFPLALITACLALGSFTTAEEIPYRRAASVEDAVERIEELGGSVRYLTAKQEMLEVDFQFAGDTLRDEHLKYLQRLENVVTLRLKQTGIGDRGLARLRKITTLRRLFLDQTAITDDGLKIPDHDRIRVRPGDGADDINRVIHVGDPVTERLVHGVLEGAGAGAHRPDLGAQ